MGTTPQQRSDVVEWNKGSESLSNVKSWISIYPQGRIGVPKSVYEQLLDSTDSVILKYAKDTDEVGIEPNNYDNPNAYSISDDMRQINCPNFLESFGLMENESERFKIVEQTDDDTIWIDMSQQTD